jgi:hypothetical protein
VAIVGLESMFDDETSAALELAPSAAQDALEVITFETIIFYWGEGGSLRRRHGRGGRTTAVEHVSNSVGQGGHDHEVMSFES